MYLFYDNQGTLKEIINDLPMRVGNENWNTIYAYFDSDLTLTGGSIRYILPDGSTTSTYQYDDFETKEVPPSNLRDLKFFKYGVEYDFVKFDVKSSALAMAGGVGFEIALTTATESITLGLGAFVVDGESIILPDENISIAQWNYLMMKLNIIQQGWNAKEDKSNKVTTLNSSSTDTQYPSAKCVYDLVEDVRAIARGKNKAYVISLNDNSDFSTNNATILAPVNIITADGETIATNTLNQGDEVWIIETEIPDRWYKDGVFYKMETSKVDLTNYATISQLNAEIQNRQNADTSLQNSINSINNAMFKKDGSLAMTGILEVINGNGTYIKNNLHSDLFGFDANFGAYIGDGNYKIYSGKNGQRATIKYGETNWTIAYLTDIIIYTEGDGILLNNDEISIDTSVVAEKSWIATNYYDKSEVDSLISSIEKLEIVVVNVLPTASASTMNKIYLVPSSSQQQGNTKDEYITIRSGSEGAYTYAWEQIGTTSVDLSNYYTKTEIDNKGYAKQNWVTTQLLNYVTNSGNNSLTGTYDIRDNTTYNYCTISYSNIEIGFDDANSDNYASYQKDRIEVGSHNADNYAYLLFPTNKTGNQIFAMLSDIPNLNNYYTKTETTNLLNAKQNTISDLSTIRSGASAGATALQPSDVVALTNAEIDAIWEAN